MSVNGIENGKRKPSVLERIRMSESALPNGTFNFVATYYGNARQDLPLKVSQGNKLFLMEEQDKIILASRARVLARWLNNNPDVKSKDIPFARSILSEIYIYDILSTLFQKPYEIKYSPFSLESSHHDRGGDLLIIKEKNHTYEPLLLIDVTMAQRRKFKNRISKVRARIGTFLSNPKQFKKPEGINETAECLAVTLPLSGLSPRTNETVYSFRDYLDTIIKPAIAQGVYTPYISMTSQGESGMKRAVMNTILASISLFESNTILDETDQELRDIIQRKIMEVKQLFNELSQ